MPVSMPRKCTYNAVIATLVALSMAGCAVLDPVQKPYGLKQPPDLLAQLSPPRECVADKTLCEVPAVHAQGQPVCQFAGCIDEAIAYGDAWRRHYYQQVEEVEVWRNTMLGSILPITAFALYKGAYTDNWTNQIGALAATAGVLYGTTRFFGLPDAQKVHLAGGDSLTCTLLQARKLIVTQDDVNLLGANLLALRRALDATQAAYSAYRVRYANGLPDDQAKALQAGVLKPIEKRLAFYESVYRRGRAIEVDARTSGDAVRRQVDLIVNATAKQIIDKTPDPEALLGLVANFRTYADKIGQGAFPAPQASATDTKGSETGGGAADQPASPDADATPAAAPKVHEALNRKVEESPVVSLVKKEEAKKAISDKTSGLTLKQLATEPTRVARAYASALGEATGRSATSRAVKDLSARLANGAQEAARARLAETPTAAALAPFDALLQAMGNAKTIEFHITDGDGRVDLKGTYTRAPSEEQRRAAAEAATKAKAAADRMDDWVDKQRNGPAAESYLQLAGLARYAEVVYHQIVGWGLAADGIPPACNGDSGAKVVFKITPELTDVTLVVGKPMTFIVSNDKHIPKISLAGKNTDKVKFDIAVNGDDFAVSVTASGPIEDGEEAVLVVGDASGKRKIEVKLQATAK